MHASRLLRVLMLLQARGRMSAPVLARELEVSVRTVYRDVEHLSAAGIPVLAERGRDGGFQLLDNWRTRLTGLTPTEAQALLLAGLPGPAAELGLGEAMATAQLKLLASLPSGWEADARRVSSRFHLDPVAWYRSSASTTHLAAVAQSVWNERRLRIRYESWKGVVEREIDPLGLVLKAGEWYVVGSRGGKPRTYRLSNILALTAGTERFTRPKEFDLAQYWAHSTRRFEAEIYRGTAVVRVSPRGWKRLRALSAAVAEAAEGFAGSPDEQGWVRVTIPIESVGHATQEMLKLGAEAEVLEPAALRDRMAEAARQLAALY